MIRSIHNILPKRCFHFSLQKFKESLPPHKDGLYFGQFTQSEYEDAKKVITDQIAKLENEIKGDQNTRENIGKVKQFPEQGKSSIVSNLSDFFKNTIQLTGPISLSSYMRQCLTHPEFGYYTTRDPLDLKTGDFITSPEISSVFGEMLAIWYFTLWQAQDKPHKVKFIEFGPGKGTLINDILSTFNKFVDKLNMDSKPDIEIIMIEASKVLRNEQWRLLCGESNPFETTEEKFNKSVTKWGNEIVWMDTEKSIFKDETSANYIIAHEFFDALPIKSFIKNEDNTWRELMVENSELVENDLKIESNNDSDSHFDDIQFHLTTSPKETPSSMIPKISKRYRDLPIGSRIEICPDAELYLMKMVQLLNQNNGGILIIDYGTTSGVPENSLRGIYKHKFVSPFFKPGEVDLSIDVDFENMINIIKDKNIVDICGPTTQGDFLQNIGIGYRIDQLIKSTNDEAKQDKIYNSYTRLTAPKQMGSIYKFLGIIPKNSKSNAIGF